MWFQSPEYLRWSRMHLLTPENQESILRCLDIQSGERVLDVGCGTGEFTRYIAQRADCTYVGIDIEDQFIEIAKGYETDNLSFLKGDALALPFEDGSFDAVVSHTFFTGISDPAKAMEQMRRVCRPGGKIISVTADSFSRIPYSAGYYPDLSWLEEYRRLKNMLDRQFLSLSSEYVKGIRPEAMPRFFALSGLKHICVYQIGKFFSLSNGIIDPARRAEYLECEFRAELSRLYLLPEEERDRYVQLLELRKKALSAPENSVWEWSGGSNLLIVAEN